MCHLHQSTQVNFGLVKRRDAKPARRKRKVYTYDSIGSKKIIWLLEARTHWNKTERVEVDQIKIPAEVAEAKYVPFGEIDKAVTACHKK